MSIEHRDFIDALILYNDSKRVMAIWNPLQWNFETFLKLQTKINAYLSSDLARSFLDNPSNSSAREFEIKLISRRDPNNESRRFLEKLVSFQEKQGINLSYETSPNLNAALESAEIKRIEQPIDIRTEHAHRDEYYISKLELATSPPQHYAYHCFISYTNREEEVQKIKPFVDDFIGELQTRGIRACPVFYDGFYLRSPQYDDEELIAYLRHAIKQSAFMIAFLSPGYFTSEWCTFEIEENGREHRTRGNPARRWSLLPIEWKDSNASGWCRKYARYLRIAEPYPSMTECVDAVGRYHEEWYPEMRWDYSYRC